MRLWLKALAATVLMQAVSSFLTRVAPVIGPALTDAAGAGPEAIGYLAAATSAGTVWALIGSASVLPRLGPLRLLQIGAVVGAAGLLVTATAWWPAMMVAAFVIGAGYAPSPPAGSDILARHAPQRHQGLIFSVKQAAVPIGGVAAGLLIPPAMLTFGWRGTLLVSAIIVLAVCVLVQPWRGAIDAERDPGYPVRWQQFLSIDLLTAPFRFVAAAPGLAVLSYCGFAFAVVQGSLIAFLVTYLASDLAIGLTVAGLAFAAMQATGSVGRVGIGWIADRVGSNRAVLALLAGSSSTAVLLVAAMHGGWPDAAVIAVSAVSGIAAVSWNGISLAEIARIARHGRVAEATAGSTVFTFVGYTLGPTLFAEIIGLTGSYRTAFVVTAIVPLTALALLLLTPRLS